MNITKKGFIDSISLLAEVCGHKSVYSAIIYNNTKSEIEAHTYRTVLHGKPLRTIESETCNMCGSTEVYRDGLCGLCWGDVNA